MSRLCYISVKCVDKYAIKVCAAWHQREQENK